MQPGRRRAVAGVVAVLFACSLLAPAVAGHGGDARTADGPESFAAQAVDADDVLMQVRLREDGSARWSVRYRVRLETDNETEAFRSLRDDVRANPDNYTRRFGDRIRATVRAAENATGREMAVENVTVTAEIESTPSATFGVLTYRFEWSNFAAVDGETLRAGDAIGGLFIDDSTQLQVRWPEGYELGSVTPSPDSTGERSVTWEGARDFGGDQPRVVVERPGPLAGLLPVVVGGAVLVLGSALAWWLRDRLPGGVGTDDDGTALDPGGATADPSDGEGTDAGGDEESADPPEELLSNEERVLRFVDEQGGRVKQQEIVQEMDWTEAKTSQVVRDLRDDGRLEGFRLGRENVLRLPEADESPAPDEE